LNHSNKIFKETELIAEAFDEFKYGCSDDYQELADFMLFYNGHCYPRYNIDDWVDFGWSSFTGERQPNHLKIPDELLNKITTDLHIKIYGRLLMSVSEQLEPLLFDVKTSVKI
jgi:hypothetical protein